MEVVLGAVDFTKPETGRRTFTIKRIINHPDYLTFQGNDVALVELKDPVTFSNDIQPLCLSRSSDVFTRGSLCYTSGWGKMDPDCELDRGLDFGGWSGQWDWLFWWAGCIVDFCGLG